MAHSDNEKAALRQRIGDLEHQVDHLRRQFLLMSERNEELQRRITELETEKAK